jgi:hypothetical protein
MSVVLTISVPDVSTVLQTFSHIRVKRSTGAIDDPYALITANSPAAGTLLAPTGGNYDVEGKTLSFKIDGQSQVDVLFTGSLAPLTTAEVVDQINTEVGEVVASDDNDALRMTSTQTGTGSSVEIIGGSAAAEFGWSGGERDIGEDANIPLIEGQSLYNYTDQDGVGDYFYVVHYYNQVSNLSSADSDPFQGEPGTVVDATTLSIGKVSLITGSGKAVEGQSITFYSVYELLEVGGVVAGVQRKPIGTIVTDAAGKAEIPLLKGLRIKVAFDGTSIIREFVVPDTDEFDVMTVIGSSPDQFDIQEVDFGLALRRTL